MEIDSHTSNSSFTNQSTISLYGLYVAYDLYCTDCYTNIMSSCIRARNNTHQVQDTSQQWNKMQLGHHHTLAR